MNSIFIFDRFEQTSDLISLLIIPYVYQLTEEKKETDFFKQVVDKTLSINNEINRALKSIKAINGRTHMLSITAKIEANRTGDIGRNFLVVSNSIDELSVKTDNVLDKMKSETIQEIETISKIIENKSVNIKGNRLANLALTNTRIVDRNLFERSADIRWWATDDILIKSLVRDEDEYQNSHERLNQILNSYSVYHDLILCDVDGICKSTGAEKFGFSGQNFSDSLWFKSAMNTDNGTCYGFQPVSKSTVNDDDFVIVYSCKIHEDGDVKNKVIGVLGAVFQWKKFAQRIINETALSNDEKSNTRVLLCDDSGKILADSHEKILVESLNFNGQQELFKMKKGFVITSLNERKKLISHASSSGFEGCTSENWHSLIIQDIEINNYDKELSNDDSLDSVLGFISNISEKTQNAIDEINKINDDTQVLSINAAIESARIGDSGRSFGVISGFMNDLSRTTAEITTMMAQNIQQKISELNSFISSNSRQIQGERLASLSFTNIDLIDRTLYERTADVRWWATENSVIESLIQQTNKSKDYLSNRLETILRYYTVYDDLIVCDLDGNVIANGDSLKNLRDTNIKNSQWFQNALNHTNEDYGFEMINEEIKGFTKIVFYCNVYQDNTFSEIPIGILGIVFNWSKFINCVFNETPLHEDEFDSTSLFILDSNGNKLAENNNLKNDITYKELSKSFGKMKSFETTMIFDSVVTLGHAQSAGYEKFFTGWHSIIIQSQKSCILNNTP